MHIKTISTNSVQHSVNPEIQTNPTIPVIFDRAINNNGGRIYYYGMSHIGQCVCLWTVSFNCPPLDQLNVIAGRTGNENNSALKLT